MTDAPSDDQLDPLEAQQLLVESSLELVFQTYDDAVARKEADPVILLVDCEDSLGGQIARGWLGDEEVDDAIALQHSSDEGDEPVTTVFARSAPWAACRAELAKAFPYLASVFDAPPPAGGVLVVGITAGGASALNAPHDARP